MPGSISEADFIDMLAAGVRRTSDFMADLTEYHGGPTATEYILTADIARALLAKDLEVRVECLNRKLLSGLTRRKGWTPRTRINSQRTDVAVLESGIVPLVPVEVKIGVGTSLAPIKKDLIKICNTLESMKPNYSRRVRAASVFQVHVKSKKKDHEIEIIRTKILGIENSLQRGLIEFGKQWPIFDFRLISLQASTIGYVPTEIHPRGRSRVDTRSEWPCNKVLCSSHS